jgi:hypothetical protein
MSKLVVIINQLHHDVERLGPSEQAGTVVLPVKPFPDGKIDT